MPEATRRSGGCHCGAVRYEVTTELGTVISCNCSICTKKGLLWSFVPRDKFSVLQGQEELVEYLFNKHAIHHQHCRNCGTEAFAWGIGPGGAEMAAINVRCLDNIEVDRLTLTRFDGRSA